MKIVLGALLVGLASGVCGGAFAKTEPPWGGGQEVLAGPKLGKAATRATLVEMDFDGKLRRLEVSPEEAAVRLLELDGEVQGKVDGVIAARSLKVDAFVRENLDLLLRFSTASATNNKQEQGMLLRETYEKAEGIRQQGRLLDTVRAVLSPEHKAEFTRLVEEYRSAQIADEEAGNGEGNMGKGPAKSGKSKKEARGGIVLKIGFEQFGQDVKRAYERVVSEGQGKLEDFFKNMDLSPQQEDKVRKLTSNFAQAHIKTPATQNEKTMLFLDISAELNPEQRAKLLNYVKENP